MIDSIVAKENRLQENQSTIDALLNDLKIKSGQEIEIHLTKNFKEILPGILARRGDDYDVILKGNDLHKVFLKGRSIVFN